MDFFDECGVVVGDPAEYEEGGFALVLIKEVEYFVCVGFYSGWELFPDVSAVVFAGEVGVEPVFDVEGEDVHWCVLIVGQR